MLIPSVSKKKLENALCGQWKTVRPLIHSNFKHLISFAGSPLILKFQIFSVYSEKKEDAFTEMIMIKDT